MTALEELRAGTPGPAFADLLTRTVNAVARARNFPPPKQHDRWSEDAVIEVASAFLIDSQTPRRYADLVVHCVDDSALRARLQGAVVNFLRDRGRRTEIGRLIRRLRDVLESIDGVIKLDEDRWRLAGAPPTPATAGPWTLESAANRERHVIVPTWGSSAHRHAPVADRATITRLVQRVLATAEGSLTTAELAQAIAPRLGLRSTPLTVSLDHSAMLEPVDEDADPADLATRNTRAAEIFARLSPRQRRALGHLELSARQLEPVLGVNRTQAALARSQAQQILRQELIDDDDRDAIVHEVIELAMNWPAERTIRGDST